MTKAEMQDLIDEQRRQIETLTAKIEKLAALPDEIIRESPHYKEIQRENRHLKEDNAFFKAMLEAADGEQAHQRAQIEKLKEKYSRAIQDNLELTAHDAAYWVGMTEAPDNRTSRLMHECEDLSEKCASLEQKAAAADRYARHLENEISKLLYELRPDEMPDLTPEPEIERSKKAGRPKKATRTQIAEARRWRKEGYSIREIARMTEEKWGADQAWSASYVQKMVGSVVVEKETQQKKQ